MDIDNLGPGPDIGSIDIAAMDRGDNLSADQAAHVDEDESSTAAESTAEETQTEEVAETEEKEDATETEEKEEVEEDQPRDKAGKFTKKGGEDKIPKSRFDEAVNKERDARINAENRVRELEAQVREREQTQQATVEHNAQIKALDEQIDALTDTYNKQLLDGEHEKAAATMREIRSAERNVAKMESEASAQKVIAKTLELDRTQLVVSQLEAAHPEFNPESDKYDEDLVQMTLMMQSRYVREGMSQSAAMKAAAAKVMEKYAAKAESAKTTAQAEPEKKGLNSSAEERQKATVAKAIKADKAQPASTTAVGIDSDKMGETSVPKASTMTVAEWDALPAATKARMRGDTL